MTFTQLKHIVFVPGPSWGHLRPGLKTALRMVEKFPNLFISLFVYHTELHKAIKYLSAQPSLYSQRIKVVTASSEEVAPPVDTGNLIEMMCYMQLTFRQWITNELQQPNVVQMEGHPVGAPSLVIEDIFNGGMSLVCKDIHHIPVVGWWLMTASSLMLITGHYGTNLEMGVYDRLSLLDAKAEENFFTKAGEVYLHNVSDRLISIPGLPAHHEWETNPQYLPFVPPFMAYLAPRATNMIKNVGAVVCCTTSEMVFRVYSAEDTLAHSVRVQEPISAASLFTAFKNPITPFFIGPAVDLVSPHQPDPDSPVTQFLDRAYTEKGAHSVVYVAFGTVFFPLPNSMSHLMAALDEIPKAGLRFIFALSSAHAGVDQSWMDSHIKAGNAIFPEWTNQTAVLEHPSIHYFLSHGGWNSSTEALVRGVPMIFWPFIGDQPTNAMQIAGVHDCGFELVQVRTGPAKSTAYRNGAEIEIVGTDEAVRDEMRHVLKLSKGPRGEHQRINIKTLGRVIAESLGPGGSGDVGLENFGNAWGLL
ncbi:unnamed protein product [Rhizoctonia solani]|uniref:UDP-glycosyltransferase 74C1 n=1 Tax=Rhizoctonia solani TaxID=456999 RepID=A0A8H2WDH3_9AGAM|nr:unnamed protein product [Rhizoctonia solani]